MLIPIIILQINILKQHIQTKKMTLLATNKLSRYQINKSDMVAHIYEYEHKTGVVRSMELTTMETLVDGCCLLTSVLTNRARHEPKIKMNFFIHW